MTIIIKKLASILCVCSVVWVLAGCEKVGQTPAGGSDAEVKAAFDKLPIEERAKAVMGTPAPMDFKVKKITEMYKKEGKEPPADLIKGGGGAMPKAPPSTPK